MQCHNCVAHSHLLSSLSYVLPYESLTKRGQTSLRYNKTIAEQDLLKICDFLTFLMRTSMIEHFFTKANFYSLPRTQSFHFMIGQWFISAGLFLRKLFESLLKESQKKHKISYVFKNFTQCTGTWFITSLNICTKTHSVSNIHTPKEKWNLNNK